MPVAEWDVLIVGAGIHGAGIAQAAAAAGYKVAVLDKEAPAAGTSSRSSKLIHGGLRYLERAELGLVRESLRERELLLKIAPKLVRRQKFYIPVYQDSSRSPLWIRAGLTLYALLAGLRTGTSFKTVPRQHWSELDQLRTDRLKTVFQYWDAQTDDAALTRAVLRSAQKLGATVIYPARFVSSHIEKSRCLVSYVCDQGEVHTTAGTVVNAAGPWVSRVAEKFTPALPGLAIDNVQGAHLELAGTLNMGGYYLEVPADRRAVFALPWFDERVLLGTTETVFRGDPDAVRPLHEEIDYLLKVYRHYFPDRGAKIIDAWAGLRVLPAASGVAFKRSRETILVADHIEQPRAVSVYGGKLTGYRATAKKVITRLAPSLPKRTAIADTAQLVLEPA